MAAENKPNSIFNNSKGRKRKYLPHGKPVRKGSYPLRPGVLGFFLTCDGGRERQATNEALNLLETFYEELVNGKDSSAKCRTVSSKPLNKIIKFKDSDSSSDEDEASPHGEESDTVKNAAESEDTPSKEQQEDVAPCKEELDTEKHAENEELPSKKQRLETDTLKCAHTESDKSNDKPIDELIEDELQELGDRNKRHFVSLESGCNGVVFIQMHKRGGDPGPVDIVLHMMSSAASTRKHMSRFILRVLPAEVTCYASEEEIKNAIKPLIEQYFPSEASTPSKFAVLYEARANTGIERMAIINAVAKSVPQPHKVDLSNPDKTIIVQIVKGENQEGVLLLEKRVPIKTICLVGVVERYKELSKYNLRQLTSPQQ